jgi:hypothetical protein
MKKTITFLFAFMLISCTVHAQSVALNYPNFNVNDYPSNKSANSYPALELRGNRFLGVDSNYYKGEIWTTKGRFNDEMRYRFDQFEGTVEAKFPNGQEKLLLEKDILIFHIFIKGHKVSFVQTKIPRSKTPALLQVIYESQDLQLLRDSKKKVRTKRENITHFHTDYYNEFENDYHYYIVKGQGNPLHEIEMTAKSFSKAFPTKRSKITSFFKTHKSNNDLTLSKIADFMKKLDEN